MLKRDLLQREIEQLGHALGKAIADLYRLDGDGKVDFGIQASQQQLKDQLDLNIYELVNKTDSSFLDYLRSKPGFSHENMERFADILLFYADKSTGDLQKKFYEKCLAIYEFLENDEMVYSFSRRSKIAEVGRKYRMNCK